MPPRYSYWTIIAGGLPTAFRAAEREELLPTFTRLREKHPDAEMRWFARGKLWDSPEAARQELDGRRAGDRDGEGRQRRRKPEERSSAATGKVRDRDWRPGGQHRDPRQPYLDARKTRNLERRKQKFERKQGQRPDGDGGRFESERASQREDGANRFERPGRKPHAARPERQQGQGQQERRPAARERARQDQRNTRAGAAGASWSKPGARGSDARRREKFGAGSPRAQQPPWKSGSEQARGVERRTPNRPWSPRAEGERSRPRDADAERGRPQRPSGPAGNRERPQQHGWNARSDRPQRPAGPAGRRERPQQARWNPGGGQEGRKPRPSGPAGHRESERQRPSNRDRQRPQKEGWGPRGDADRPPHGPRDARGNRDREARGDRSRDTRPDWRRDSRGDGRDTGGNRDRSEGAASRSHPEGTRRDRKAPDDGGRPTGPRSSQGGKSWAPSRPSGPRGETRDRAGEGGPNSHEPPKRRFEPPSFGRNQGTEEPAVPPRPRGPNREPRPSESPEPAPPPRPSEPVIAPPGPPERGRLVKTRRRS